MNSACGLKLVMPFTSLVALLTWKKPAPAMAVASGRDDWTMFPCTSLRYCGAVVTDPLSFTAAVLVVR